MLNINNYPPQTASDVKIMRAPAMLIKTIRDERRLKDFGYAVGFTVLGANASFAEVELTELGNQIADDCNLTGSSHKVFVKSVADAWYLERMKQGEAV